MCVCVDVCEGACVSACLCDWFARSKPATMSTHPGDWRPCRDGQGETGRRQAGNFVDGCRAAVRRVASWLNHAASRARAGLNVFKLQVPVLGTTCHILQMDRDPLASRRSTRLVRLACHKYMVIVRRSNAIRTRI